MTAQAHLGTWKTWGWLEAFRDPWRVDLRSLALFRLLLGGLLLFDALHRLMDVELYLSDEGIFPSARFLAMWNEWDWLWSFHHLTGSWQWPAFLLILQALAAIGLLLGWKTRWMAVISWILLVSLHHRNRYLLQGSDVLLSGLLLWAIFLPISARFSVDAALNTAPKPTNPRYGSAATVALLLQAMYVYVIGASIKLYPDWQAEWIERFDAVYYALHTVNYAYPHARWLGDYSFTLTTWLTRFVWGIEFFGPFLLFMPWKNSLWRYAVLGGLLLMHLGFQICLAIGPFPMTSLCSLVPFLPSHFWDRLMHRYATRPQRRQIILYYDEPCGFCKKMCLLLREFFLDAQAKIVPAQQAPDTAYLLRREHSWLVRDHEGRVWTRWDAMVVVWQASFWGWPLAMLFRLPGMKWLGNRIYGLVACQRGTLAKATSRLLPYHQQEVRPFWLVEVPVGLLALLVFWWNIEAIPGFPNRLRLPGEERQIILVLNLDQYWNMFAPNARTSGWYVVRGERQDGVVMDLLQGVEGEPDRSEPADIPNLFPDFRWRKWMMPSNFAPLKRDYAIYLCRHWNRQLPPGKKIINIQVDYERMYYAREEEYVLRRWKNERLVNLDCRRAQWMYPDG